MYNNNKKPAQWVNIRELTGTDFAPTIATSLETGLVGIKGLGPAPVQTFYRDQLEAFLAVSDQIKQYLADHPEVKTSVQRKEERNSRMQAAKAVRVMQNIDPDLLQAIVAQLAKKEQAS